MHPKTPIAHGPVCLVERCECGSLHVTLGALTLRFDRETLASVFSTLGEALARDAASVREENGAARAALS